MKIRIRARENRSPIEKEKELQEYKEHKERELKQGILPSDLYSKIKEMETKLIIPIKPTP